MAKQLKIISHNLNDWIYINDTDNLYRFALGEKGKNIIVCFGINPSTAEPNNIDNTIKSVKRISTHNGYDGYLMLNIYPQRATNPDDMDIKVNKEAHNLNLKVINDILSHYNCTIWAAWGTLINHRDYLYSCLHDICINSKDTPWVVAGSLTKQGHPRHPLYLKTKTNFVPFDINNYLK